MKTLAKKAITCLLTAVLACGLCISGFATDGSGTATSILKSAPNFQSAASADAPASTQLPPFESLPEELAKRFDPDKTVPPLSEKEVAQKIADVQAQGTAQAQTMTQVRAGVAFVSNSEELVAAVNDGGINVIFIMNDIVLYQALHITHDINFISANGSESVTISYYNTLVADAFMIVEANPISLSFENVILDGRDHNMMAGIVFQAQGPQAMLRGAVIQNFECGIISTDDLTVYDCTIRNNILPNFGGAGIVISGNLVMYNTRVQDNIFTGERDYGGTGGGGVFCINGSAYIYNSEITGNQSNREETFCGGVYVFSGELQLVNSTVRGNSAYSGGGVGAMQVTITNSIIEENTAISDAGGVVSAGSCVITNSHIRNNTAGGDSGGVKVLSGTLEFKSGSISGNTAGGNGGGIHVEQGEESMPIDIVMSGGSISGNTAQSGAGIYLKNLRDGNPGSILLTGGGITENEGSYAGAGVYAEQNATVTVDGTVIANNKLPADPEMDERDFTGGGAIFGNSKSTIKLRSGEIYGNQAYFGGALGAEEIIISGGSISENYGVMGSAIYTARFDFIDGEIHNNQAELGTIFLGDDDLVMEMHGGSIYQNKANWGGSALVSIGMRVGIHGGEIYENWAGTYEDPDDLLSGTILMPRGTLEVTDGTISKNTSAYGGAIFAHDGTEVRISGGIISQNYAEENGGAIYTAKTPVTIADGTIEYNECGNLGGAIYSKSDVTVQNGVIADNVAYLGGGIYIDASGSLTVSGGEIDYNSALSGGGIYTLGRLSITGGSISSNLASTNGGGVYAGASSAMTGGEIRYNMARNGGGIYATSSFSFVGTGIITNNNATASGGGIYGSSTSVILLFLVTLESNTARTGDDPNIHSEGVIG